MNEESDKFRILGRSKAGTIWVVNPDGGTTESVAEAWAGVLNMTYRDRTYWVKRVVEGVSSLEGET